MNIFINLPFEFLRKIILFSFWYYKIYIYNLWLFQYYICRGTISNDPKITLGSYMKGPNNTICREWVWKGKTLVTRQRFSHVSYASSYEDKFELYS